MDYIEFLDKVFESLGEIGVDVGAYELDHICYRVETQERYEELKREFNALGIVLSEAMVNGRYISTFKLRDPIQYQGRLISVIELPAPKLGSDYKEGYEHVEFVIDEEFLDFIWKYPYVDFVTDNIDDVNNSYIYIQFDGFKVKFHKQSLEYLIKYEK